MHLTSFKETSLNAITCLPLGLEKEFVFEVIVLACWDMKITNKEVLEFDNNFQKFALIVWRISILQDCCECISR